MINDGRRQYCSFSFNGPFTQPDKAAEIPRWSGAFSPASFLTAMIHCLIAHNTVDPIDPSP